MLSQTCNVLMFLFTEQNKSVKSNRSNLGSLKSYQHELGQLLMLLVTNSFVVNDVNLVLYRYIYRVI